MLGAAVSRATWAVGDVVGEHVEAIVVERPAARARRRSSTRLPDDVGGRQPDLAGVDAVLLEVRERRRPGTRVELEVALVEPADGEQRRAPPPPTAPTSRADPGPGAARQRADAGEPGAITGEQHERRDRRGCGRPAGPRPVNTATSERRPVRRPTGEQRRSATISWRMKSRWPMRVEGRAPATRSRCARTSCRCEQLEREHEHPRPERADGARAAMPGSDPPRGTAARPPATSPSSRAPERPTRRAGRGRAGTSRGC